jgi:hypothetical protein
MSCKSSWCPRFISSPSTCGRLEPLPVMWDVLRPISSRVSAMLVCRLFGSLDYSLIYKCGNIDFASGLLDWWCSIPQSVASVLRASATSCVYYWSDYNLSLWNLCILYWSTCCSARLPLYCFDADCCIFHYALHQVCFFCVFIEYDPRLRFLESWQPGAITITPNIILVKA